MSKPSRVMAFLFLLGVCLAPHLQAQMSSTNYTITTSVLAGGGAVAASKRCAAASTLGQPAPLVERGYARCSGIYLFPGFWNTWYDFVSGFGGFLPAVHLLLTDD